VSEKKPTDVCVRCPHDRSLHDFRNTTECRRCPCDAFIEEIDPKEIAETQSWITGLTFALPEAGFGALPNIQTIMPTANGPKMIRRNKLFAAVTPVEDRHGVYELDNGVYPLVPKLPWWIISQTVAFFRHISDKCDEAEVMVQVFYDPNVEPAKRWIVFVPPQEVSKGGITHTGHFDKTGDILHVADIHSHNTMGAFWSGIDDRDERRAERFYGVIGEIDKPIPAWKWRVHSGGVFLDIPLTTIIELPQVSQSFTVPLADILTKAEINEAGKAKMSLSIDPFATATFPPEWKEQVKVTAPVGGAGLQGGFWQGWAGESAWGPSAGSVGRRGKSVIDDGTPNYLRIPQSQWSENDRLEYEADLELASEEFGPRRFEERVMTGSGPIKPIASEARGWCPPGDPFPSVYDGTKKITYIVGPDLRVTRRTSSGLNIITTLTPHAIFSSVVPKVGRDLVEVYDSTGKPYTWRH
jgi:hypothetical protein